MYKGKYSIFQSRITKVSFEKNSEWDLKSAICYGENSLKCDIISKDGK